MRHHRGTKTLDESKPPVIRPTVIRPVVRKTHDVSRTRRAAQAAWRTTRTGLRAALRTVGQYALTAAAFACFTLAAWRLDMSFGLTVAGVCLLLLEHDISSWIGDRDQHPAPGARPPR